MFKEKFSYEPPLVEVLDVQIEQGFASSGGTTGFGESDGSW